ncbi:MAG: response regulator transcription factor [Oscillospiraceae bacterium]|nr:response regulator transcription factor [Oscillospiraceae bacterium]
MSTRILIIEDDTNIAQLIRLYLEKEHYQVDVAQDGKLGLDAFYDLTPDLVLLDIMLPERDGWDICREIRETSQAPVIMLTAKGESYDKVKGLELGADDYITKPFDAKELLARVRAVLRRSSPNADGKPIEFDNLYIDMNSFELKIKGVLIDVPPKELELLRFLASSPNRVFTRTQLLDGIWGFDYFGDSRTVDVHIKRLREKLEGASEQWALKTVWGVGYKFEVK